VRLGPRDTKPVISRLVTGPVESVRDFDEVLVRGELIVPRYVDINWAAHGQAFHTFDVDVFHYQHVLPGFDWKKEQYRAHLEHRARRSLVEAYLERYTIPLEAEVVW
jgi:hypothetical protein